MNKNNNKTIISIISIIVALVICFFGYNLYQKKQAEVISAEKLTLLHELTKQFNDENDRNNKFNLLKDTLDEQSKYNLNSYKDSKVKDEFKNSINIMRDYFHKDYDNTIKENNISNLNNTSDESKFSDKKAKLDNLTKVIEIQNIVLELKGRDGDMRLKNIYWEYIFPKYLISYRTFSNYLSINAKKELKELKELKI